VNNSGAAENGGQVVTGATEAIIQGGDGNFVLYREEENGTLTALWATGTNPNPNDYVQLGDDGGLYVISESGGGVKKPSMTIMERPILKMTTIVNS
jgi:hypothetical protein